MNTILTRKHSFKPRVGSGSTAALRQDRRYSHMRDRVAAIIAGICVVGVVYLYTIA